MRWLLEELGSVAVICILMWVIIGIYDYLKNLTNKEHIHRWSKWSQYTIPSGGIQQQRVCLDCCYMQNEIASASGKLLPVDWREIGGIDGKK